MLVNMQYFSWRKMHLLFYNWSHLKKLGKYGTFEILLLFDVSPFIETPVNRVGRVSRYVFRLWVFSLLYYEVLFHWIPIS